MADINIQGLFTNADHEDIRKGHLQKAENILLDKIGVARKRDPRAKAFSHPTGLIRSIFRFINENLPNGAIWVALINYSTYTQIEYYDDVNDTWTVLTLPGETRTIRMGQSSEEGLGLETVIAVVSGVFNLNYVKIKISTSPDTVAGTMKVNPVAVKIDGAVGVTVKTIEMIGTLNYVKLSVGKALTVTTITMSGAVPASVPNVAVSPDTEEIAGDVETSTIKIQDEPATQGGAFTLNPVTVQIT